MKNVQNQIISANTQKNIYYILPLFKCDILIKYWYVLHIRNTIF